MVRRECLYIYDQKLALFVGRRSMDPFAVGTFYVRTCMLSVWLRHQQVTQKFPANDWINI